MARKKAKTKSEAKPEAPIDDDFDIDAPVEEAPKEEAPVEEAPVEEAPKEKAKPKTTPKPKAEKATGEDWEEMAKSFDAKVLAYGDNPPKDDKIQAHINRNKRFASICRSQIK